MRPNLKPLADQVIVITGASSRIGLTTARKAAQRGSTVVLSSRNEEALQKICAEIVDGGGKASYIVADVSQESDVVNLAERALEQRGQIDSWVNAAAVPIYGELLDVPMADHRRIFEVNYWGSVYGSMAAIRAMEEFGGALINLGSVLSDIHIPLQGPYVATKHAIKGFTDTLRLELRKRNLPVSVTLIKPGAIDTPYAEHARTYMAKAPTTPPPRYAPDIVAKAILHACEQPSREIRIGGGTLPQLAAYRLVPRLYDWMSRKTMYDAQITDESPRADVGVRDNLYEPKADGHERSSKESNWTRETSFYTEAMLHPRTSFALLAGAVLLAGGLMRGGRERRSYARAWR